MARPERPERSRSALPLRQLSRFCYLINSDIVFGTHSQPGQRLYRIQLSIRSPIISLSQRRPNRYTATSWSLRRPCQKSARNGSRGLFDHLVGEREQRQWVSTPSAFAVLRVSPLAGSSDRT